MPFLERFIDNWATEDLVKQFMKNRRSNHYRKGWLEVPEKYGHLKANAQKRDKNGSRRKKALSMSAPARNQASTSAGNRGVRVHMVGTRVANDDDEEEEEDSDEPNDDEGGQGSDGWGNEEEDD
jgi:hypothetical protein